MNTGALLHTLQQQVSQLAKAIADSSASVTTQPRFDNHLFRQRNPGLIHYLHEIEQNVAQLNQEVEHQHRQQVAFLAEHIVAQISALHRELATLKLREQNPVTATTDVDNYQKLAQHQDYERRLSAMLRDKEQALLMQTTLQAQQIIQKELAALEGRLTRCRQALRRIEKQIELKESGEY